MKNDEVDKILYTALRNTWPRMFYCDTTNRWVVFTDTPSPPSFASLPIAVLGTIEMLEDGFIANTEKEILLLKEAYKVYEEFYEYEI